MDNRPHRCGGVCGITQAHANWIKPPGWARSLARQFPPPSGGAMQSNLSGTPVLPR
ncbi:MAG: hypothetical protein JWQ86_4950 [Mycobacterium sp.]|nr:hypothetical protein [Mycobacterium sp.]